MRKNTTKICSMALAASMICSLGLSAPVMAEEVATEAAAEEASTGAAEETSAEAVEETAQEKVRTIITTDGEEDDQCSLIRYFLYANEFELEGIVSTSSNFHFTDQGEGKFKGKDSNQVYIDGYAQVYENLCQHAEGYPTPEFLTEHNFEGNVTLPGEMDTDTEGSLFIRDCLLDEREDRLLLQAWGGTNTIAAALRSIEDEYKDTEEWEVIYQKICNKAVIVNDLDQDDTISNYLLINWPNLPVLLTYTQYVSMAYPWDRITKNPAGIEEQYYSADWIQENLEGKGVLADLYIANLERSEGAFLSEGDTPCYFYGMDVGLRSFEDPSYGGWGGRYEQVINSGSHQGKGGYYTEGSMWSGAKLNGFYVATDDDGDYFKPLYRWIGAFQNDFAARMEWCTNSYEEANHEPEITLEEGVDIIAKPGETVTLTAKASDPDGDDVAVSFWQYTGADTYGGAVELTAGEAENQITFVVPEDAKAYDTIHVIAEVTDSAEKSITRYQRAIIVVKTDEAIAREEAAAAEAAAAAAESEAETGAEAESAE
ncbi:MAG: DUF1593 domain-containing protein [Lachnospiraceae bacterium]|nr:DUF1593 domain-containing protein [Lachnospiraceae bacterium]